MREQRRKARQTGVRGNYLVAKQTKQITVRISPPVEDFLERLGQEQVPDLKPRTAARFALEMFKAMKDKLEPAEWLTITQRASERGQDPGSYIGALLKSIIETEKKAKK